MIAHVVARCGVEHDISENKVRVGADGITDRRGAFGSGHVCATRIGPGALRQADRRAIQGQRFCAQLITETDSTFCLQILSQESSHAQMESPKDVGISPEPPSTLHVWLFAARPCRQDAAAVRGLSNGRRSRRNDHIEGDSPGLDPNAARRPLPLISYPSRTLAGVLCQPEKSYVTPAPRRS